MEHGNFAGNTVTATDTFDKDTTLPSLSVTSSLAVNIGSQNDYSLEGTCGEEGQDITVDLETFNAATVSCTNGSWTWTPALGTLTDRAYQLTLTHSDGVNDSVFMGSLVRDTQPPTLTVEENPTPINFHNQDDYIVSGECDQNGGEVTVTIGTVAAWLKATCDGSTWFLPAQSFRVLSDAQGIALSATYSDEAGNSVTATATVDKDVIRPVISLENAPEITGSDATEYSISGRCDGQGEGREVTIQLGTLEPSTAPICQSGNWSIATMDVSSLYDEIRESVTFTASLTDTYGNRGESTATINIRPLQVKKLPLGKISAHQNHTCVITSNGRVKCWGVANNGRLGRGLGDFNTPFRPYPVNTVGLTTAVQISSGIGGAHSCVILKNGNVKCWGDGSSRQLDNGQSDQWLAEDAIGGAGPAIQVVVGQEHTCSLKQNGRVKCWGSREQGQTGDNISSPQYNTGNAADVINLGGVTQITAGDNHNCAVTYAGRVRCWGSGGNGRLGNRSNNLRRAPVSVYAGASGNDLLEDIVQVSGGGSHTCALTSGGWVKCWGRGSYGRLGNRETADRNYPVSVYAGATGGDLLRDIVQISLGADHTCALTSGGQVKCWGRGEKVDWVIMPPMTRVVPSPWSGLTGAVNF